MVFPIAGGNESKGYEISNSLRFNDGDSPELYKTLGSPTNNKIYTFSFWTKRSAITGSSVTMIGHYDGSASNPFVVVQFRSDDKLRVTAYDNDTTSVMNLRTNAQFRDHSAWYHIVLAFDTTQGTASNRVKVYVNGNQVTSFHTETYPDQNKVLAFNKQDTEAYYGVYKYGNSGSGGNFYDGYITELHFIDGQQKAQTDFGRFDDNGVWIPKKYTGTYGNNGHFFEFQQTGTSANSSGIGADTSGQDNHFAVTNLAATDVTEDTCTNNFATMNPLESDRQQGGAATFAEGNLQITTSYVDSNYQRYPQVYSTQAVSSGKWYFEMKISTSDTDSFIGVHSPDNYASDSTTNPYGGYASTGAIYTSRGAVRINDAQTTGLGTTSQNDIVGCALDIDNNKVYFHKNGTYVQSGDPAGNSGGQAIPSGYIYGFTVGNDTSSNSGTMQVNFGNPVHTISSGNTDGKYGNFEYAVPSGFYAVCTKRLAEFG